MGVKRIKGVKGVMGGKSVGGVKRAEGHAQHTGHTRLKSGYDIGGFGQKTCEIDAGDTKAGGAVEPGGVVRAEMLTLTLDCGERRFTAD